MDLTLNGNAVAVKYNFASLLAWRDILKDDAKDDSDIYDDLITGLINDDPMVTTQTIYGGLAYLDVKPTFGTVFDAVSELLGTMAPKELSTTVLQELNQNGFFGAQIKHWKANMDNYKVALNESLKILEKKEPAKNAKKEDKEAYNQKYMEGVQARLGIESSLELLGDKLNPTENTSSQPEDSQESQA